jgi:hypothetical protein
VAELSERRVEELARGEPEPSQEPDFAHAWAYTHRRPRTRNDSEHRGQPGTRSHPLGGWTAGSPQASVGGQDRARTRPQGLGAAG